MLLCGGMRKLVVPTACVALAACNPGSGESAQNEQASATAEQVMAADGESPEGRYRATSEEGVVLFEDLNEDGTYVFTDEAGEVVEEGQFEQKSPESPCFTPTLKARRRNATLMSLAAMGFGALSIQTPVRFGCLSGSKQNSSS